MKHRVLFVDDEPMVLQGLQRTLRSMREEWDMAFVDGAEKALAAMEERPFDVVVTDMRMPGMNGAELLAEVMRRFPTTVRLVLSGHADKDLVSQCLGVAHQYLSKPCDAEQLKSMVRNACLIGGSQVSERIKQLLGSIDGLPSLPQVFLHLERALASDATTSQELGDIIQQDMGMTAKILKIVNSAFFGLRRTINGPQEAVVYLGTETIKVLVLANSIFERSEPLPTRGLTLEDLWRHSMLVSQAAKAIARLEGGGQKVCEQIFVAGILEDVGILVLASHFPEAYDRVIASVLESAIPIPAAEQREFGITHAEVGTYLLGLWGLPAPILAIVGTHHQSPFLNGAFVLEQAVAAADILAGEGGGHPFFRTGRLEPPPGLAEKVKAWRRALPVLDETELMFP